VDYVFAQLEGLVECHQAAVVKVWSQRHRYSRHTHNMKRGIKLQVLGMSNKRMRLYARCGLTDIVEM
jgi:hypothetical protein